MANIGTQSKPIAFLLALTGRRLWEGCQKAASLLPSSGPDHQQLKSPDLIVTFCYGKWHDQKLVELGEYLRWGGRLRR
ncbi:hypothetical protein HQ563_11340 [bacterium]|nr:hypothetical protein [bacterium]